MAAKAIEEQVVMIKAGVAAMAPEGVGGSPLP